MRFRQKAEPKALSPLAEMHLDNAPEGLDFKFGADLYSNRGPPITLRGNHSPKGVILRSLPETPAKELFLVNHAGGFLGVSRT